MNCISEAAAGLIGAGVSAAGSAASITMGGKMNQRAQHEAWRTRAWQTKEREASQAWQLEQWNRQNEYNSPVEQLRRARAAGINPLAVINGDFRPTEAGMPSGAQAPGGAQAQFHNPMDGADVGGAMNNVLKFKQLELAKKKTDAEIKRMDFENSKDQAETLTKNLLRDKEVELMGANIKLTLANERLSTQEVQNKMQEFLVNQQQVKESIAQVEYLQGQSALADLQRHIMSSKLPFETKLLAQQYLNMVTQRAGNREDNIRRYYDREMARHELEEYYENGRWNDTTYYGRSLHRKDDIQDLQHRDLINEVKAPWLGTVDKGIDSLQGIMNVVGTFTNFAKGLTKKGVSLRSAENKFQGFSTVERGKQPNWSQPGKSSGSPFF